MQKRTVLGVVADNICVYCACQRALVEIHAAKNAQARIKVAILVTQKWAIEKAKNAEKGPNMDCDERAEGIRILLSE